MNSSITHIFPSIIGNELLRRRVALDILNNSLFHAIMLVGEEGYGKRAFAYQIAAALSCEKCGDDEEPLPCGECSSCKKILNGNSPDVIFVDREDHETIGVQSVRYFRDDAYISSNDSDFKVYIINDIHTMTPQAQNAALKILEEPPKNVYFLLLCESTQSILETIMSRVITFYLEPVKKETLLQYLTDNYPKAAELKNDKPDIFNDIIMCARGSVGRAVELIETQADKRQKILEEYNIPAKLISILATDSASSEYLDYAQNIPQERKPLIDFFEEMSLAARDIIAVKKAHDAELLYYISRDEVSSVTGKVTCGRAYRIACAAQDARDALAKNVNVQLLKVKFIFELRNIFNS